MPPQQAAQRKKVRWPLFLFLTALIVPWIIFVGPVRLSVYRIVLLMMILPCLFSLIAGRAGRIRIADIALLLFSFWCVLSLIVIHGAKLPIQSPGIILIETLGPYALARCYIRDADDFYNVVQLLFRIIVLLLPFAAIECLFGQNILRELFQTVLQTLSTNMPSRLGLTRAQTVFDHPILFGVYTGSILALAYMVLGFKKDLLQRLFPSGVVGATSLLSLSSGPLTALFVQVFLLSWDGLLKGVKVRMGTADWSLGPLRWALLIGALALSGLMIALVANRSVLDIVVSYFLFDTGSYWFRKVIWAHGTESVSNNPYFGVGLNDWERPGWMANSIDNFWLFLAVHYGLPAAILLLIALSSFFLSLALRRGLSPKLSEYRTGLLITMTSFFVVSWTVHFWDAAYVIFFFWMGSGVWMLDGDRLTRRPTVTLRSMRQKGMRLR